MDNKWYVGCETVTNGDTVTGATTCDGAIDEFRVWREDHKKIDPLAKWCYAEWPWLGDESLALYARFNETTGDVIDYSVNENHGSVTGSPTRDSTALVTRLPTIRKLRHFRASDGTEKWLCWADDSFYAKAVQ